jgi:excinuclease ABC subunit C
MESTLERTLAQLPDMPGVYMMIGNDGQILYIGKAVSLRSRVRSYFQDSAAHAYRTVKMVERVVDVRTIVVSNEIESLILEANLIKRHQPPFNVRMRDDKRFPYLKVTNEPFPRVVFTRVVRDDGARYFGPYTNASGLRELIDLVRIVFPLRTCREPIDGNFTSSVASHRASDISRKPTTTCSSMKSCCFSKAITMR